MRQFLQACIPVTARTRTICRCMALFGPYYIGGTIPTAYHFGYTTRGYQYIGSLYIHVPGLISIVRQGNMCVPVERGLVVCSCLICTLSIGGTQAMVCPTRNLCRGVGIIFTKRTIRIGTLLFIIPMGGTLMFLICGCVHSINRTIGVRLTTMFSSRVVVVTSGTRILARVLRTFKTCTLILFTRDLGIVSGYNMFYRLSISRNLTRQFLQGLYFKRQLDARGLLTSNVVFVHVTTPLVRRYIIIMTYCDQLVTFVIVYTYNGTRIYTTIRRVRVGTYTTSRRVFRLKCGEDNDSIVIFFSRIIGPTIPGFATRAQYLRTLVFLRLSR